MRRRDLLAAGVAALGAFGLGRAAAHTPYGQWVAYRKTHLLVGCHRKDEAGCEAARDAVARLEAQLPAARAKVARAPAATRLASLLATDQLDVAVLASDDAEAMRAGDGVFAAYGAIDLVELARLSDDHALFAHSRFAEDHAALVADALKP